MKVFIVHYALNSHKFWVAPLYGVYTFVNRDFEKVLVAVWYATSLVFIVIKVNPIGVRSVATIKALAVVLNYKLKGNRNSNRNKVFHYPVLKDSIFTQMNYLLVRLQ